MCVLRLTCALVNHSEQGHDGAGLERELQANNGERMRTISDLIKIMSSRVPVHPVIIAERTTCFTRKYACHRSLDSRYAQYVCRKGLVLLPAYKLCGHAAGAVNSDGDSNIPLKHSESFLKVVAVQNGRHDPNLQGCGE